MPDLDGTKSRHEFVRRPFVCGVLGVEDLTVDSLLLKRAPPVHEIRVPNGACRIWTSSKSPRSLPEDRVLLFGSSNHPSTHWEQSANEGHAGVSFDGLRTRIFASATGLESIYYRRIDQGMAFASSPGPLMELSSLTTDWDAWIDILALGYPINGATQTNEIKHLEGGKSLVVGGGRCSVESYRPFWANSPDRSASVSTVLESVESAIPHIWRERPAITLSGGWDSRLLAAVGKSRSLRAMDAYTTNTDDGSELDVALSPPVARGIGLNHDITYHDEDLRPSERSVRQRTFYETWMHTWLDPLASRLRREQRLVIDGLAGDVLLKNLFVSPECVAEPNLSKKLEHVWMALVRGSRFQQEGVWPDEVAKCVMSGGRDRFLAATEGLTDHPAGPTLAVIKTRTARGIVLSPKWMFAPECKVLLPFAAQSVMEASLSVPLELKSEGAFYRKLLSLAAPSVAGLPSTNDTTGTATLPQKQLSPLNLSYHTEFILGSPDALRLLPADISNMLHDPRALAEVKGIRRWLRPIKVASLLGEWQMVWSHRLKDSGSAPW